MVRLAGRLAVMAKVAYWRIAIKLETVQNRLQTVGQEMAPMQLAVQNAVQSFVQMLMQNLVQTSVQNFVQMLVQQFVQKKMAPMQTILPICIQMSVPQPGLSIETRAHGIESVLF